MMSALLSPRDILASDAVKVTAKEAPWTRPFSHGCNSLSVKSRLYASCEFPHSQS